MKKYFDGCHTSIEVKKRYRDLAKKMHPDKGGKGLEFIELKRQYEYQKKQAENYEQLRNRYKFEKVKVTDINALLKSHLKKVVNKKVKRKKIIVKHEHTVYTVNLNQLFNGLIDRFL